MGVLGVVGLARAVGYGGRGWRVFECAVASVCLMLMCAVPAMATSTQATAIAAGREHTCALTSGGGVDCWGGNEDGQLGDGTYASSSTPVAVKGVGGFGTLAGVTAVAAGGIHTCALTSSGGVDCWGFGGAGARTPFAVPGVGGSGTLSGVAEISVGGEDTCALIDGGGVDCWGVNFEGELGDGSSGGRSETPVEVEGVGGLGTLSGVKAIASGTVHTCALMNSGGVVCWGDNSADELGDGTSSGPQLCTGISLPCSRTPVEVKGVGGSGTLSGVTGIDAGGEHTCAVTGGGQVVCWGDNSAGGLGDGSTADSSTPVEVKGVGGSGTLWGVAAVAAGVLPLSLGEHTCALTSDGRVDCWGENSYGQLGDGTETDRSTPVEVKAAEGQGTLTGVEAIAAGGDQTCALTSGGGVDCWGDNEVGQLGDGSTLESATVGPVEAVGGPGALSGMKAIAAGGSQTCALTSGGGVDCWGADKGGQLGDGLTMSSSTPVVAEGMGGLGALSGVKAIATEREATCAVTSAGGVDCWGIGGLGDGSYWGESSTPVAVDGVGGFGALSGMVAVSAGRYYSCALTTGGGVDCWGDDEYGQLGYSGEPGNRSTPVWVEGVGGSGTLSGVTAIAAGAEHACALTSSGGVVCWGDNRVGQLGNGGAFEERSQPVEVKGVGGSGTLSGVKAIATGDEYSCALTSSGGVDCWGGGYGGELGDGSTTEQRTPVEVKGVGGSGTLSEVIAITAGTSQACALTSSGGVDCWGENSYGQLGDGTEMDSATPVEVKVLGGPGALSGVEAIAAGSDHTCALTNGGEVDCWGENHFGQLGDGSTPESSTPVTVSEFASSSIMTITSTTTTGTPTTSMTATSTSSGSGSNNNDNNATTLAANRGTPPSGSVRVGGLASVTDAKATLKLACAGSGRCKGTVQLVARVSDTRTVMRHGKRRVIQGWRNVIVATASFSLPKGATGTLELHLSAEGKQLLRKAGKKGLQVGLAGDGIDTGSVNLKAR